MGDEGTQEVVVVRPTTPSCPCSCHDSSQAIIRGRSIKRKLDPSTLLASESFESITTAIATASTSTSAVVPESETEQLRETIKSQEQKIRSLYEELDEERNASTTAANETMAMILRLQSEKAAAQMEVRQVKRFADERIAHDDGELEELEEEIKSKEDSIAMMSLQIETYRERMKRHGIEPDGESDDGLGVAEQPDDISSERVYNNYAIYQPEMNDNVTDKILVRIEAMESSQEDMRREVISMRTEKLKFILLRDYASRLCAQLATERRVVNNSAGGKFSLFGVFKWAFSVFFKRNKSRGVYGLKSSSIGFLLLLGLSTRFGQSKTLPRAKR